MTAYRVFITGAGGMLATALLNVLTPVFDVTAFTETQLDITDRDAVLKTIKDIKPDVVVNAAAYTAVDKCEEEQKTAKLVNGFAVGYIAEAVKITGARLFHISTDYIFDGDKDGPYTEEDKPNPVSVYGLSKLIGERELVRFTDNYVIIRTQWMFGENGKNFVDTIIQLAEQKDELKIVDDQYGSPTYTRDVAVMIKWFIENSNVRKQIFNFSNEGIVSWYGFARGILKLAGIGTKLVPVDSSAIQRAARRPHNSALDKTKIKQVTRIDIRPWYDALYEYMKRTGRVGE